MEAQTQKWTKLLFADNGPVTGQYFLVARMRADTVGSPGPKLKISAQDSELLWAFTTAWGDHKAGEVCLMPMKWVIPSSPGMVVWYLQLRVAWFDAPVELGTKYSIELFNNKAVDKRLATWLLSEAPADAYGTGGLVRNVGLELVEDKVGGGELRAINIEERRAMIDLKRRYEVRLGLVDSLFDNKDDFIANELDPVSHKPTLPNPLDTSSGPAEPTVTMAPSPSRGVWVDGELVAKGQLRMTGEEADEIRREQEAVAATDALVEAEAEAESEQVMAEDAIVEDDQRRAEEEAEVARFQDAREGVGQERGGGGRKREGESVLGGEGEEGEEESRSPPPRPKKPKFPSHVVAG